MPSRGHVSADLFTPCGSCGALLAPTCVVCSACGVRVERFAFLGDEIRAAQQSRSAEAMQLVAERLAAESAREAASLRRRAAFELRLVAAAAAVLVMLVLLVIGYRVYREHAAAEQQKQLKLGAERCLAGGDFVCAREDLLKYLRKAPHDQVAVEELRQVHFDLAQQLAGEKRWKDADHELSALLDIDPTNTAAHALRREVDGQWLGDARSSGDWTTALRLSLQRVVDSLAGGR